MFLEYSFTGSHAMSATPYICIGCEQICTLKCTGTCAFWCNSTCKSSAQRI